MYEYGVNIQQLPIVYKNAKQRQQGKSIQFFHNASVALSSFEYLLTCYRRYIEITTYSFNA